MADDLLVYGSYGYTGKLIVKAAADRGLAPTLAGRRAEPLESQATDRSLDHRTFSLEHPTVVEHHVREFDAVLNCAGPYSATADPLLEACLRSGTDYLDLAGQIDVLESIARRDERARDAGVTLLPAVGFDVVPTDCLAVHLAEQVDDPTSLRLAIDGLGTFSPGTVKSIVDGLKRPGAVREGGEIRGVPAAWRTREFDFDGGRKEAVTVPWGDVSTAYYATGIPNIETYATVPGYAVEVMERTRPLAGVLGSKPVRSALTSLVDAVVTGPSEAEREKSVSRIVGEVESDAGERAVARMRTPDTYDLTAETAVESARRVLDGEVDDGFQTPGGAFGPDYALEFEGVERRDVEPGASERAVPPSQR